MSQSARSSSAQPALSGDEGTTLDGLITLLRSLHLTQSDSETLIGVLNERVAATVSPLSTPILAPTLVIQPPSITTPSAPPFAPPPVIIEAQDGDDQDSDEAAIQEPITVNVASLRAPPMLLAIEPQDPRYHGAEVSMADECRLSLYRGMFYNLPALSNPEPPFYYVTRGRYIGVFAGWDNTSPKVQGVSRAIFAKVESLEVGEEKVRNAIKRSEALQV